jgi:hypothetical protein
MAVDSKWADHDLAELRLAFEAMPDGSKGQGCRRPKECTPAALQNGHPSKKPVKAQGGA